MQKNKNNGMDLFGKALYNYQNGDKSPLYFYYNSYKTEKDLNRYTRTWRQLTKLEKKAIKLSSGNILDVGCATGYYLPYLEKQGNLTAIDISEYAIKACKERGQENCFVQDIFTYTPDKKFNTITLLENNLGLGGTIKSMEKLLIKLTDLLDEDGKILFVQRDLDTDIYESKVVMEYKGEKDEFKWLHTSAKLVNSVCNKLGLQLSILGRGKDDMYLGKITAH